MAKLDFTGKIHSHCRKMSAELSHGIRTGYDPAYELVLVLIAGLYGFYLRTIAKLVSLVEKVEKMQTLLGAQ